MKLQQKRARLSSNFETFERLYYSRLNGGDKLGNDPYLSYFCDCIAKAKNPGARIVVNVPPRHLKSFTCAVCLPAWLLAINPAEQIMVISYSESLAEKHAFDIRKIMRSKSYQRYFKTRLDPDRTRAGDFATTEGGGVFAVSIDGSMTGRGASIIIFDDPLKISDGSNAQMRQKVNELFDTMILSRLNHNKNGRIVIVAHRLHPNDLSGHVLRRGGWDHVALPFVAPRQTTYEFGGKVWTRQKGELLRPDAFSKSDIKTFESAFNPDYGALYQQYAGDESFRITRHCFGLFEGRPGDEAIVCSVDPGHRAGEGHSFTVIQVWCRSSGKNYLLYQARGQWRQSRAVEALKKVLKKFRATAMLIEHTGYGEGLADEIRNSKKTVQVFLIETPKQSKSQRLIRHRSIFESKLILLPNDEWRHAFFEEFESFPNGDFDDQVDATTQFLDFIPRYSSLRPRPQQGPAAALALASRSAYGQPAATPALNGGVRGAVLTRRPSLFR